MITGRHYASSVLSSTATRALSGLEPSRFPIGLPAIIGPNGDMTIMRGFNLQHRRILMKKQLVKLVVAIGFLAITAQIQAQDKMAQEKDKTSQDKMSSDKMSHDKMGAKDKMKKKNGQNKGKKTDKMGN